MRRGGILRITTPDARKIAQAYIEGRFDTMRFNEFFFQPLTNYHAPSLFETIGMRIYPTQYHMWLFDSASLNSLLGETHFVDIEETKIGAGRLPDLDRLENFTLEEVARDRGYSIYVEASK